MVWIDGVKFSCAPCIKGHRSANCVHPNRALSQIKKKGRPPTQCGTCRAVREANSLAIRCICPPKVPSTISISPPTSQHPPVRVEPYSRVHPKVKDAGKVSAAPVAAAPNASASAKAVEKQEIDVRAMPAGFNISSDLATFELPSLVPAGLQDATTFDDASALPQPSYVDFLPLSINSATSSDGLHLPTSATTPSSPYPSPAASSSSIEEILAAAIAALPENRPHSIVDWSMATFDASTSLEGDWDGMFAQAQTVPSLEAQPSESWNALGFDFDYSLVGQVDGDASGSGSEYSYSFDWDEGFYELEKVREQEQETLHLVS